MAYSQMGLKANLASEGWQKSRMNTAFLQRLLAKIESIPSILKTLGGTWQRHQTTGLELKIDRFH